MCLPTSPARARLSPLRLSPRQTLEMVGMDLNDINPNVSPDYRSDPDAYGGVDFDPSVPSTPVATNRNIGLELTVKMNYTNRHAGEVNCGSWRACSRGSSTLASEHAEHSAAHVPPQP